MQNSTQTSFSQKDEIVTFENAILERMMYLEDLSRGDAQSILEAFTETSIEDLYRQGVPVTEAAENILNF